jgi:hypothetical protein
VFLNLTYLYPTLSSFREMGKELMCCPGMPPIRTLDMLLTMHNKESDRTMVQLHQFCRIPEGTGVLVVGTLRTGYLRVQAPSQDNGSRLPAKGSSEAARCPRGSGFRSRLWAAPGPPRAPVARDSTGAAMCPRGSGQLQGHHVPQRLGAAPGPPHVTWAPTPTFWSRAAPELPRVTWALRAASK